MCLPSEHGPSNAIASRVLADPYLTYDVSSHAVVIAIRSELLVSRAAAADSPALVQALERVADPVGRLGGRDQRGDGGAPVGEAGDLANDVELWRLREPEHEDSIDQARRLRRIAEGWEPGTRCRPEPQRPPAVSPHHVAILAPKGNGCPASPPRPARPRPEYLRPFGEARVRVAVLDSGYLPGVHPLLDERVGAVDGEWFDSLAHAWTPDSRTDETYLAAAEVAGVIDGLTGHGTFIAGQIAHLCPDAAVRLVGLRDQELPLPDGTISPAQQRGLYASELSIAHAMLTHADVDVIQCGFAFPTLDDYPPLALSAAVEQLACDGRERAIVAPAGNESSRHRYWPAALPGVIGVAATNRRDRDRADFSNWGRWCDACSRGEDVHSTFCRFTGAVGGEGPDVDDFDGWARWSGTSFAAPRVSALIARRVAEQAIGASAAWAELRDGALARDEIVWDYELDPTGVGLPQLG
jgi:hypothetical protein